MVLTMEDDRNGKERHTAEEIVAKLRQADLLMAQGKPVGDAVRAMRVTEVTYCRWRNEYGGLKGNQVGTLETTPVEPGVTHLGATKWIRPDCPTWIAVSNSGYRR
jgi:putative transposase